MKVRIGVHRNQKEDRLLAHWRIVKFDMTTATRERKLLGCRLQ